MTLNKDIAVIIMFSGLIILIIGGIELTFPVQGIHLLSAGLLILFAGFYFHHAESEKEKVVKGEL